VIEYPFTGRPESISLPAAAGAGCSCQRDYVSVRAKRFFDARFVVDHDAVYCPATRLQSSDAHVEAEGDAVGATEIRQALGEDLGVAALIGGRIDTPTMRTLECWRAGSICRHSCGVLISRSSPRP